jgi:hypothetical protein
MHNLTEVIENRRINLKDLLIKLELVKIPLSVIYSQTIDRAIEELKQNDEAITNLYSQLDAAQAEIFKRTIEVRKLSTFIDLGTTQINKTKQ